MAKQVKKKVNKVVGGTPPPPQKEKKCALMRTYIFQPSADHFLGGSATLLWIDLALYKACT